MKWRFAPRLGRPGGACFANCSPRAPCWPPAARRSAWWPARRDEMPWWRWSRWSCRPGCTSRSTAPWRPSLSSWRSSRPPPSVWRPALRASGTAVTARFGSPRAGVGGATDRLRPLLIVSEVAFAVVLLMGGGLMMRALAAVLAVDPGLRAANVWSARLSLPPIKYRTADDQRAVLRPLARAGQGASRGAERLRHLFPADVRVVTERSVSIEGRPAASGNEELIATVSTALPDYFETLGHPAGSRSDLRRPGRPAGHAAPWPSSTRRSSGGTCRPATRLAGA